MHRFRAAILTAFLGGILSGCSDSQPNAPAAPEEVNTDFAVKSAMDMKNANSGMDPKAAKKAGAAAPKK